MFGWGLSVFSTRLPTTWALSSILYSESVTRPMTALLYTSCDFVGSNVVASRAVATTSWPPLTGLPAALAAGAVVGAAAGAVVGLAAAAGAVVGAAAAAAVVGAAAGAVVGAAAGAVVGLAAAAGAAAGAAVGAGLAAGPHAATNRPTPRASGNTKESLR